jgi:hypothetical protein
MTLNVSATANGSGHIRSFLLGIASFMFVFLSGVIATARASHPLNLTPSRSFQARGQKRPELFANAHPYLEEPFEKLVKRIPELKALQAAPDQHVLPIILEKTGERVDEFFRNVVDLAAHDYITEEKLDEQGNVTKRLQVEVSYLILRRGTEIWGRVREYRMDAKGNPMDEVGLNNGYFVTANFALNHIYFSTALQSESTFLYLGEEKIGSQDTYVVALAQKPGQATITVAMEGREPTGMHYLVHVLVQGIAWVDERLVPGIRMSSRLPSSRVRPPYLSP